MSTEEVKSAAEICQWHIDDVEAKRAKASLLRSDLTDALASAVLDLLYLTRNTDREGQRRQEEFDRDMARMREGQSENSAIFDGALQTRNEPHFDGTDPPH